MKYKKNSFFITLFRSISIKLGLTRGRHLVSVFSKSLIVDLDISGISKAIFCENYREIDHTNIYSEKLFDKEKILDLGANIGYYVLQAATDSKKNSNIVCIEPDPRNLKLLKENIINNDLSKRVKVVTAAVTGEEGKVLVKVGGASNLNRVLEKEEKNDNTIEVNATSLNALQQKYGIFDCLRMDVEGAESIILSKNSDNFLKLMPLGSIIFMEIHPGFYIDGDSAMIKAMDNLYRCGFSKYEIVTSGRKQDSKITERLHNKPISKFVDGHFTRYHYTNVLFDDAKYFILQKPKVIRYLIAEKK
jgi:FkbM family methyltransferase